ncbi:hypothetical protein [Zoogloea sp.]|uniref:hypothetical protein n=1 Tax=Zoogloea sp. TaxID=49181 RepID=UPI0035B009CF
MNTFITAPGNPGRIRASSPPADFGLPVRTLDITAAWRSPATATLLAAEIGRRPGNLHAHMQRISIWQKLGNPAQTAAAVIDLWIALGACGIELRTRVLHAHQAALEQHNLDIYLHARLHRGIDRHAPEIALRGVVLATPVEGSRAFLRPTAASRIPGPAPTP